MKIKTLAFIMWGLFLAFDVHAQEATIYGQVKKSDGQPVGNAVVSVGAKFDITDTDGRYRIKDVKPGRQTMQIKKDYDTLKEEKIDMPGRPLQKDVIIPTKYWVIVGSYKDKAAAQEFAGNINNKDKEFRAFVGLKMPGNDFYPVIVGNYVPLSEALKLKKRALQLPIIKGAYLSAKEHR